MRTVYGVFLFLLVATLSHAYSAWRRDEMVGFPDEPSPASDDVQTAAPPAADDDDDVIQHGDSSPESDEEKEAGQGTQGTPSDTAEEETNEVSQVKECDHQDLEFYLEQLVNNSAMDIYLQAMTATGIQTPFEDADELYELLGAYTGYDIRTHSGRHTLACDLTHIKNLDGLALFFHAPKTTVAPIYEAMMEQWRDMGGMQSVNIAVFLSYGFSMWMIESGYPNVPLKKDYKYEDIRDMMKGFQAIVYTKSDEDSAGELMEAMASSMMPIQFLPEYTAKAITDARSRDELAKQLCIDPMMLSLFDRFGSPQQLTEQTELMLILYRILNEIDDMGLFDLSDPDI